MPILPKLSDEYLMLVMSLITAPLFSSRLFEYGTDAGDEELPPSLDAAKKITIAYPLRFYGMDSSTVYVSPPHVFV
ncbi:unnamed protein product [Gongylonema pulchrum]|uniref:Secreted protein n=1 Tax=Gongylonema pulchrum TaxID=637853 RepID=A0A183EAY5_9BILA|nr:unnamed protein product [Gongylonema pulchrum]